MKEEIESNPERSRLTEVLTLTPQRAKERRKEIKWELFGKVKETRKAETLTKLNIKSRGLSLRAKLSRMICCNKYLRLPPTIKL